MTKEKNKITNNRGLESKRKQSYTLSESAGSLLMKICGPFAEEYGPYLKDKFNNWRVKNFAKISQKTENKLEKSGGIGKRSAHPRMVFQVFEHGSWIDDDDVQEMWAGLLASSCTESGKDDSNLLFINLLSQLTTSEVKILNHACKNANKSISEAGWIHSLGFTVSLEELKRISGIDDHHRIDRELDHLQSIGLLGAFSGFESKTTLANVRPSAIALHMYTRCQGSLQSPVEFFGLDTRQQE
jgi:hypothetical protein